MRNWNPKFQRRNRTNQRNCEPTYEELKYKIAIDKKNKKVNCEPTYEELKYNNSIFYHRNLNNCEPTYEELKYKIAIDKKNKKVNCEPTYEELKSENWTGYCDFLWIASLPMRNCNAQTLTKEGLGPALIASLPMRNWNLGGYMNKIEIY